MRVVAGLGNPGPEYVWTRHNVGFVIVQKIATQWNAAFARRDQRLEASCHRDGELVRLVLPQSYMNRSGEVIGAMVGESAGDRLTVVYDDVDLPVGAVRIRKSGGAGGHRGVASVIEHCGAEFTRVRVGVGRPPQGQETADYVLAPLAGEELERLTAGVDRAVDAVACALTEGVDVAMNRFNGAPLPAEPSTEGDRDA